MARNFSRRHKMTPMAEINVTPLLEYRYVALDKHGAYFLDDDAVSADRLRAAFAEIAALPAESQPIVRIRADGQLAYQKVIDVFDMAKKQGLSKVAIDTEVDQAAGAAR